MSTTIEFRLNHPDDATTDTDLVDVELTEAFNRSASTASLTILDADQNKLSAYPYYERLQVQHSTDGGNTWTTRLEGFAVDRVRTTERGFPALRVEMVGYNHLLRRRHVHKTYSSSTISTILQDLIETFTAVTWNASNVSVQNDKTISREFSGERVDEAINYLASISADEEWVVNNDLEFVFQQQDTSTAAAIGDTDVIRHNFPNEGKVAINRYELFFGPSGGRDRIIVEDLPEQETLKDKLGAARAVEVSNSDTLPEITDRDRAEEIARQRLDIQSEVTTGTVTVPLGRFGTEVGDVLNLTVTDAGIVGEDFRVAGIEYRWQDGVTKLTLAENVDFVDDILVALSDSLDNVRAREADPSVTATQFLDVRSGVALSLSATLTTKTPTTGSFIVGQSQVGDGTGDTVGGGVASATDVSTESQKATAALLDLCRDYWQGAAFTDLTHLGVGTDDTGATRGDTALTSAVDRETVEKFGKTSDDEFSPSDINSLSHWYDAAAIAGLNDGDSVASWADQEGTDDLTQATGSKQPTYKTGIINGQPIVRHDGVGDLLQNTFTTIPTPLTIICVGAKRSGATDATDRLFDGGANNQVTMFGDVNSQGNDWTMFSGSRLNSGVTEDSDKHIWTCLFNGASSVLRLDGTQIASGNPGDKDMTGLTTAARADETAPSDYDIGEILIFNANLSNSDRNSAESYLADKWGIAEIGTTTKSEFTGTIPAGGVYAEAADLKEFGIFDADSGGSMYARVTFADTAIDATTRLKVRLVVTVDTDGDLQGVTTTTGQQRLVDLITGDTTAHEPSDMVYGTGTTGATESDVSLGSQSHEDTIDSFADRSTGVTDIVEEVLAGDANTTGFSEVGYENAANELLGRVTFPALAGDVVLVTTYRWVASNA